MNWLIFFFLIRSPNFKEQFQDMFILIIIILLFYIITHSCKTGNQNILKFQRPKTLTAPKMENHHQLPLLHWKELEAIEAARLPLDCTVAWPSEFLFWLQLSKFLLIVQLLLILSLKTVKNYRRPNDISNYWFIPTASIILWVA